ncbi:DUF4034 domain-containing protein [Affinibrenneria salicis]|uniref:DUF4034 domain-containing protein n=1 Tax=Affinibrenneria salicis TaxID=2590031 RepID=UPI00168BD8D3|nr:DUF4034 domain-containing protein [Affinibrenneria salicis]
MLSFNDIFTTRAMLRGYLQQGNYAALSAFLDNARRQMKANRDAFDYLFFSSLGFLIDVRGTDSRHIAQQLVDWHDAQPDVGYPCQLLANHWLNIASEERGGYYAEYVCHNQWQRAYVSNELLFYWAAKAISLDKDCAPLYLHLLMASGHFYQPAWFLNQREPIVFTLSSYSDEAVRFVRQQGGWPTHPQPFITGLPPASDDEEDFPPRYWLERVLECDAQNLSARKQLIYYLYPRWYGDDKHKDIDNFIASDYCRALSPQQRNVLLREKEYDSVNNPGNWPASNKSRAVLKLDEDFRKLLSLDMSTWDRIDGYLYYAGMCNAYLLDAEKQFYKLSSHFARRIYDSLTLILASGENWQIFNYSDLILTWLSEILAYPEYGVDDSQHLLQRCLEMTQGQGDGATERALCAFAGFSPALGLRLPLPAETYLERLVATGERIDSAMLETILPRLIGLGSAGDARRFLQALAGRDVMNAALLLNDIYGGRQPSLAAKLEIAPAADRADQYLQQACRQHSAAALFLKSRVLEDRMDAAADSAEKSALQAARCELLRKAIAAGHPVAQYDYACALVWSDDERQITQALRHECAAVLLEGRVSWEQLAYMAYVYAFAALNARGMEKNYYLAHLWIEFAQKWDTDKAYTDFQLCMKQSFGFDFVFKRRAKKDQQRVPEWMSGLIEKVMRK